VIVLVLMLVLFVLLGLTAEDVRFLETSICLCKVIISFRCECLESVGAVCAVGLSYDNLLNSKTDEDLTGKALR